MTPKKQRIYIIVILICFLATGGVLYYGFFSSSSGNSTAAPLNHIGVPNVTTDVSSNNSANPSAGSTYSVPSVFPNDTKFNWSLVDSAPYKALNSIPDLDQGPVGRPNPFSP